MQKLLLLDGSYLVYRSILGMRPLLRKSDSMDVGAAISFTNTLLRYLREFKPTHAVCVFDKGRQSFRMNLAATYKEHREEQEFTDSDKNQVELMRELAAGFGFAVVREANYEADDMLASYCQAFKKLGQVIIVSADKDMMQLLCPTVKVVNLVKGELEYKTHETVKAKWGISPQHAADYQALTGDGIDNVSGVRGIGPKAASWLVNKYGNIYSVLDAAYSKSMPEKYSRLIIKDFGSALTCYKQTLLDCDVRLPIAIKDASIKRPDRGLSILAALESKATLQRACKDFRVSTNIIRPDPKWSSKNTKQVTNERTLFR